MPVRVDLAKSNERILSRVYEKLYSQIINNPAYPFDIITLKRLFNDNVYVATRKAIQDTYQNGVDYVGKKLKTDTYITQTDIDNIKRQTDKAVNQFWGRIQNDMDRAGEQKTAEFIGTEPKDDLSTLAVLQAIPTIAMFSSLAISSISKVKQIKPQIQPIITSTPLPPLITNESLGQDTIQLPFSIDVRQEDTTTFTTELEDEGSGKIKFEWVAQQDEKTCLVLPDGSPGCALLDGQIFEEGDPDLRIPGENGPNGSHSNCRCYLDIVTE